MNMRVMRLCEMHGHVAVMKFVMSYTGGVHGWWLRWERDCSRFFKGTASACSVLLYQRDWQHEAGCAHARSQQLQQHESVVQGRTPNVRCCCSAPGTTISECVAKMLRRLVACRL